MVKHNGDVNEVAEVLGITARAVYFSLNLIKKKGFSWEEAVNQERN